ncbi:hypothetical protein HYZ64_02240 [Candidatus Berkelbacteria bacterium]|nr:hypothetical protein [Candidatus Berkelbacteria bacterium]
MPTLEDVQEIVEQFCASTEIKGPIEQIVADYMAMLLLAANDTVFRSSLMADYLLCLANNLADEFHKKPFTKGDIWAAYGVGAFWVLALEYDLHKRSHVDSNAVVSFQPMNAAAASGELLIQPSQEQAEDLIIISQYFYGIFRNLRGSDEMQFIDLVSPLMLVVAQQLNYSLNAEEFADRFGLI